MSLNCLPGTPCYDAYYHPSGNCGCSPCIVDTANVIYYGPNLPNSGVNTDDPLNTVLQKLDNALTPENIASALINAIATDPVLAVQFCTLVSNCYTTTTTSTTQPPTTTTTTTL
jgi:hypothetical protein